MSFKELKPTKIRAVRLASAFARRPTRRVLMARLPRLAFLAAIGPGLVSGFADNDAGGITTYSVVGAQFGYDLMWALLASMLALGITQEVGARLGLATGKGLGDLIREQFGVRRPLREAPPEHPGTQEDRDQGWRARQHRAEAALPRPFLVGRFK